jgi:hypothetical protein
VSHQNNAEESAITPVRRTPTSLLRYWLSNRIDKPGCRKLPTYVPFSAPLTARHTKRYLSDTHTRDQHSINQQRNDCDNRNARDTKSGRYTCEAVRPRCTADSTRSALSRVMAVAYASANRARDSNRYTPHAHDDDGGDDDRCEELAVRRRERHGPSATSSSAAPRPIVLRVGVMTRNSRTPNMRWKRWARSAKSLPAFPTSSRARGTWCIPAGHSDSRTSPSGNEHVAAYHKRRSIRS